MGSKTTTPQLSTGIDFASTRTNSTVLKRADSLKSLERGRLLPLLPDEITTTLILPRLPWRAIISSSQLNYAWRAALRSPMVRKLRAQVITSQTIVTIDRLDGIISLYDTATRTWHRLLPRIPLDGWNGWGCVTLHGNLYILEGKKESGGKIYVFDIAGQGQWKECASMKHPRSHFGCEAFKGKIYVFGGDAAGAGNTAEVYDPEKDLWSDLAPMLSHRIEPKVVIIDDVFCVHGGRFVEPGDNGARWHFAQFADIYDPRTGKWTKVENFAFDRSKESSASIAEAAVVIGGRLHGILNDWLYVYEEPLNGSKKTSGRLRWDGSGSWKAVQPISWDVFHPANPSRHCYARRAVAIGNGGELFTVVLDSIPTRRRRGSGRTCIVSTCRSGPWTFIESKGLGVVGQTLTWQRIPKGPRLSSQAYDLIAFPFPPDILSIVGPW